MTARKTLPRAFIVPVAGGSDPGVVEIEDCTEVYGDNVVEMFPEVRTDCENPQAPNGEML